MSGLDELTREELVALAIKLHETMEVQAKQIVELEAIVGQQAERIVALEEEVARLRGGTASAVLAIKASVVRKERVTRKKRKQSFARHSLAATQVVYHAVEECPECGRKLSGGSEKWRHQVIEVPRARMEVTNHIFVERRCGVCGKRWTPDADVVLSGIVVGKRSVGITLMSQVAHLKTVCRVPIGQIRKLLDVLYGLRISAGGIAEILHDVAEMGESAYEEMLSRIRGSPVICADETGWREDGVNG